MPNVTTEPQVITGKTPGFEFLLDNQQKIGLLFSGAVLATTVEVGMYNDEDPPVFVAFTDGAVTALPRSLTVLSVPSKGIAISVAGGIPNFNITAAGAAGPTGP